MIPQPVEAPPNTEAKRILLYIYRVHIFLFNHLLLQDKLNIMIFIGYWLVICIY